MATRKQRRAEQEIFNELASLCASPGYVHVIAYLSFRDNMIPYSGDMKPENMRHLFSQTRLIRTELSTLIGLLLKKDITYDLPAPDVMKDYVSSTEALLEEMHESMSAGFWADLTPERVADKSFNPFTSGAVLREPIFYGGESAYGFQYRDFSPRKYAKDDAWLKANKGFSITTARDVVHAVGTLQNEKAVATFRAMNRVAPDQWTLLPGYEFSVAEVAARTSIDPALVDRVLIAFTVPVGERNTGFTALHDFNIANASPVLRRGDTFILFHIYSLGEALYEAPFYWMGADRDYVNAAMRNRGLFTEEFSAERLALVFGKDRVHTNVDIFKSKTAKVGEIDVLVIFGNRAIVLQAKSKRLTLESRKGNDGQIRDDFKKSVQNSYDQGLSCARLLLDGKHVLMDAQSRDVVVTAAMKEVYVLCVIADHYPALSFQARQFLKFETSASIPPPFVLDVFALDAMTEMLDSPLRLLSYVDRRVKYSDKLMASHELTILSYHLKQNLWLNDKHSLVMLEDSISTDLDLAMLVRRDSIPGKSTPDGILTRLANTTLGRLVKQIESSPDPGIIDLGFMLLTINEDTVKEMSQGIDKLSALSRADSKSHDMTVGFGTAHAGTGLTIHCNSDPISIAGPRLETHCKLRKYSQQAQSWFGICLNPSDSSLRFGLNLDFTWQQDSQMDELTQIMGKPRKLSAAIKDLSRKPGRNEPCTCGSGKKFKKCCGKRY